MVNEVAGWSKKEMNAWPLVRQFSRNMEVNTSALIKYATGESRNFTRAIEAAISFAQNNGLLKEDKMEELDQKAKFRKWVRESETVCYRSFSLDDLSNDEILRWFWKSAEKEKNILGASFCCKQRQKRNKAPKICNKQAT